MDRAELETFRTITRWTIATYLIAIVVTLAFGLDTIPAMAG